MFIVLLGAPGSGKGTAGEKIAKDLKLAHISTGDLFRENLKNETELGKKVKEYIDKRQNVPSTITIKMLKERLKADDVTNGAVLDGFPRTKNQAICLDKMLSEMNKKVDMSLNIDVPFEEIVERIANRRSCRECNEIYNVVFNPPKVEGICDKCGGELYQREDQKPEIVQNRLKVYSESAQEIIDYYENANVLYNAKAGDRAGKTSYDVAKEVEEYIKNK